MVECISNVIGKVLVEKGSILNSFFKLLVNYDYDYNYDYALIVGEKYFVLGGFVKNNCLYYYIYDNYVRVVPAILFDIEKYCLSGDMSFYVDNNQGGGLGVIFNPLNKMDCWYEMYLDEDIDVMKIVNNIIIIDL
ncbi:hypothetical protein Q5X54_04280 [Acinetobacter baumannii]|uniref:hypothetical protein n=1 Tax=Acinetobacter baumannii TaxID=470 RepID=UPI0026F8EE86|nr:hypothetical protein [Acinetobacter baumannii]MDO7439512.1 hypothetical protein [Acinetobacter baumannii]MDV4223603.1 hypothetical protein [Acinetobacter baumannii]MDV7487914.1 hypothetical protein [Acinetobacter baumannii]